MANVEGPTETKKRILMSILNSILLYGCDVRAARIKEHKKMLTVQRIGALRIASAYRRVSGPAVMVIASVVPINLLGIERCRGGTPAEWQDA